MGSDKSTSIREASKYLINKYMPGFEITYLTYTGILEKWAAHLAEHLSTLEDELIIFGLDDFLIEEPIDMKVYDQAVREIGGAVVCAKLCDNTPEEFFEYPVSAQLTIWKREYLIWILNQTTTPWKFEQEGSRLFDKIALLKPCIKYDGNSALSSKWPGINFGKVKDDDIYFLRKNNFL